MNGFKTDLITKRDMTQDFCWILTEPLVYENDTFIITVMDGFDFDFASIPSFFRGILPKNGMKYDRAACLHDALYASKILPRGDCDLLFFQAMLIDGVNELVANIMYDAVDVFGGKAYRDAEYLQKYRNLIKVELKNA